MELLPLLDAACRGATVALLLLLVALLACRRGPAQPSDAMRQVGLLLALGLVVQVVAAQPSIEGTAPSWWRAPLVGVSMGNAVLGWLFVRAVCDDDFRLQPWHRIAWLAVAAAGTLNLGLLLPWCAQGGPAWAVTLSQLVQAVPLGFGLLSVLAALRHWQGDLVERRRWLRAFIVVGGTAYPVLQALARQQRADGRLGPVAAALDAALLLVIVAAVAWLMLRPGGDGLVGAATGAGPAAVPGEASMPQAGGVVDLEPGLSTDQARALEHGMVEQGWYRDAELSLAGLATRLGVPEYRLRRHINGRLGHRNFPAYLNGYRLTEARRVLSDPACRERSVLAIALDAGFGSIGPFNRAFKAATGLTPSDFRRQSLADS